MESSLFSDAWLPWSLQWCFQPHWLVCWSCWCFWHYRYHRLVEDLQHLAAHLKGSELPYKWSLLIPFLYTASLLLLQRVRCFDLMLMGVVAVFFIQKSTSIFFVLLTFRRRWFLLGRSKMFLHSDSCPPLLHLTTAVSSFLIKGRALCINGLICL